MWYIYDNAVYNSIFINFELFSHHVLFIERIQIKMPFILPQYFTYVIQNITTFVALNKKYHCHGNYKSIIKRF